MATSPEKYGIHLRGIAEDFQVDWLASLAGHPLGILKSFRNETHAAGRARSGNHLPGFFDDRRSGVSQG
jgi:hypothetical protein